MQAMSKKEDKPKKKEREIVTAVKGVAYGMALHGMVTYALRLRMHMENLFMLITMGDMLGVPVLPPYYSLRLLPYAVPFLKTWKQTLLRDRDITDSLY
jgi:hypothetical protein